MTHKVIYPESKFKMLHILGCYKESSHWCLHDPKEHKKEQELRGNWMKVCYLLHIVHPKSIFLIFLITSLNSDIDLLDSTKLGN